MAKNLLIGFMLLLLVCPAGVAAAKKEKKQPFKLDLVLIKEENRETYSSDTYYVSIINQKVKYAWQHYGPAENQQKHHQYNLSPQGLHNLKVFILQHALNRKLHETKSGEAAGVFIKLNLTLSLQGKTTKTYLYGMYRQDPTPEAPSLLLENTDYVRAAQKIIAAAIKKSEDFGQ